MKENLRQRAFLNSLTGLIDYLAKMFVGFFLNPFMISTLGTVYFGAWQVIGQLNSYMATADIRAATSLKYILSKDRSISNDIELKRVVSSALFANLVFIPLYLIGGVFIVWFAPVLSGVSNSYYYTVRVASSFLVLSFILTQLFFLFESTLHGMNLAYKRIGIRALITIFGGVATVLVLYLDYGIIGMAVIQVLITIVTGFTFWRIVKANIPWFSFVKVKTKEVIGFIKLSGWYMIMKFSDLLNQSVDMILLGYLAGPRYVSSYAITKYLMIATSGIVKTISNGASIGIAKFIGERRYDKLLEARIQLINIQWLLIIIGGCIICLINKSFITLWTKGNLYAGSIETLLIVFIALFTVLYQIDSSIVNSTLNVKKKIIFTLTSAVITIGLSFYLVPHYNIFGLLIAILIGTAGLALSNTYLVAKITCKVSVFYDLFFSRMAIMGLLVLISANYFAKFVDLDSWLELILFIFIISITLLPILWFLGLNKMERVILQESLRKIKR